MRRRWCCSRRTTGRGCPTATTAAPRDYRTLAGRPGVTDGKPAAYVPAKTDLALYDLEADPGEKDNVAEKHPDVVERLTKLGDKAREELGDSATKKEGKGVRPPGRAM